jgi:hypothetical protein
MPVGIFVHTKGMSGFGAWFDEVVSYLQLNTADCQYLSFSYAVVLCELHV